MSCSADYYSVNAIAFFDDTVGVDMSAIHERFLALVPKGGLVLDAGCGSGRDAREFKLRGYRVAAFDASPELAALAGAHIGQEVLVRTFADVDEVGLYDGIWACASLLHLPSAELPDALKRLWRALKPGGVFYLSFKEGRGERTKDGRHFTDLTELELRRIINELQDVFKIDCWQSRDARPGRSDVWLNALVRRKHHNVSRLITGGSQNPFLPSLLEGIRQATEIEMTVAFIKATGLRLLFADLKDALAPSPESNRAPARLRIITSDYLDVTDPEAMRSLMLLQERGAQVKVYESAGSSFHMKSYIFVRQEGNALAGMAFVGSSNISAAALKDGLEWNYRIDVPNWSDSPDYAGFAEIRSRFEELFADPRAVPLTHDWIDGYEQRRRVQALSVAPGSHESEPPPLPTSIQNEALLALTLTRQEGFRRGLVVMATGLGKTWLAAFDSHFMQARRVLFVAHREEILFQAENTFLRIRPHARVGFYTGQAKDEEVDILCASVQTLGKLEHLIRFPSRHFDYVVVDEFHHAAAATYRRLLSHFEPRFLLGLTATPERSDQSDILSLCDDNLVFSKDLFVGVTSGLLVPFHYYGIFDEEVDYREIPWRSGKFDPEQLSNKLATLARARHAHRKWQELSQERTLAFCVSIRHAQFMAERFRQLGVKAEAVYAGSAMARSEALEQLTDGRLQVIFSVDLFNEGVDLPGIDTVMLLRPTESKILFLQQIGRGLRTAPDKDHLVILDFIGNHQSFLHKPQALFKVAANYKALAQFARQVEQQRLTLPEGCFANYDLELIDFLKQLDSGGAQKEYEALRESLGRRPTLSEFYRSGALVSRVGQQYGNWFSFVDAMGDLGADEIACAERHGKLFREVEITPMTKSFKMVLLEALLEHDGLITAPALDVLAAQSLAIFQRRRRLIQDIRQDLQNIDQVKPADWRQYWDSNPVNAWIGGNRPGTTDSFFHVVDGRFTPRFKVAADELETLTALLQELVDFRFASYEARSAPALPGNVVPLKRPVDRVEVPYFPNIQIACGHFKSGNADAEEYRSLGAGHGKLDPARHFIARASGNSMNGGKNPIHDGDYLLLERITPGSAGSITGLIMAIERQDAGGDNQYLLRMVTKPSAGRYVLKATNPDYEELEANEEMRTFARLKEILDPLDLAIGRSFIREDIPALFGEEYNPGNWNVGHVVLKDRPIHVLLVTLNKQGKAEEHRYHDYWIDEQTFHWQSQNSTSPESKRGRELIDHKKMGIAVHLFVRDGKLAGNKAAPFTYHGEVTYAGHKGSEPMSVEWRVD
ncbi:Superfamily II DNA or RNA helicase [Geobacter sp. DSM 9736]|nr:Superfamily II DNA or RNA helicase [Geobacter sp. DSM 9736]